MNYENKYIKYKKKYLELKDIKNQIGGNKNNIMDHIYKTPEEAKRASKMLGLRGEIHSHETPQGIIYMPGPTM